MRHNLLDKLQLKRIEKKIAKKKSQLVKYPIQLEDGEMYCTKIVFFSSKIWLNENVKGFLEDQGYKVVRIPLKHKVVISWR